MGYNKRIYSIVKINYNYARSMEGGGVHSNDEKDQWKTFLHYWKFIHISFFSSCVINNLQQTIFRSPHQITSKDFHHIGDKNGEQFYLNVGFGFDV